MRLFSILLFFICHTCRAEPQTPVAEVIKIASEKQVVENFKGCITFVGWSGKSTPDIKRYLSSLKINTADKNYWIIIIDNNFSTTVLGGGMVMALDDDTGRIVKLSRWQ